MTFSLKELGDPPQGPPSPREPDSLSVFSLSFDQQLMGLLSPAQLQPVLLCMVPSPRMGRGAASHRLISEFQPLFAAGWLSQAWLP